MNQGTLGLASGKDPHAFDRVWLQEPVEPADITFDFDTYLLTATKAKALKQAPAVSSTGEKPPPKPPVPAPPEVTPPVKSPAKPEPAAVVWEGDLQREQWNLFSLKVLTRLAQADDLKIEVKVWAKLKEGQSVEQLNTALKELGLEPPFTTQSAA